MKLFKKSKWLKHIFELELILIVSILSSFLITYFMIGGNTAVEAGKKNRSGLFEKYRVFSSILSIKPEPDTAAGQDIRSGDPFVQDFLSLKTIGEDLKEKSYGIIDDFIEKFKSDDPYLNREKDKLHLKNQFIKKNYSQFVGQYKQGTYGFDYDMMLLKSHLFLKDETNSLRIFQDLYMAGSLREINPHLTQGQLAGFLNRIEPAFWNKKFESMTKDGNFSEFGQISRYIKDKQLVNYISAEINYSRKNYARTKTLLAGIRSARYTAGKEKLLLKMRIREDDFSDIDQTLEKLMSDREIYKRLLLDISTIFLIKGESALSSKYYMTYISTIRGNGEDYDFNYWRALWTAAWLKVKEGDKKGAALLFSEGAASTNHAYKIANSFWSSVYNGENMSVIRKFPFTYYYARYSIQNNLGKNPDLSYFVSLFNNESSARFYHIISRVEQLLRHGLTGEAIEYLQWTRDNTGIPPEDVNALKMVETLIYLKKGDHYHTFISFRNNFSDYERIILPYFLKEIYLPLRYNEEIEKYCSESGVEKELVLALMNRESMFRENIISPARAKGLMQIIDSTAAMTAGQVGMTLRKNDIYKPEINIRLGVAHLKFLLEKYSGKVYLALAAYNAGSHRVKEWLEEFGEFEEAEFIEMIPFSETRNYVKNVIRNYYYYKYYYSPGEWDNIKI